MSKGDIIKTLITESGLPITEIARRINVDRRTIYTYMKKDNWKPETLKQISIACNKDANYLLKKILDSNSKQGEDKQIKIEEPNVIYHSTKKLNDLLTENAILLHKLVELQEKHILLHEEYLQLKKTIPNKQ
ncbi:HTH domain-containing protein [Labilibaculum sp. K2S]|uniref:terminase gpP N-terminus-related DNA-binding protein n=1 Tax=Labilibaculum sp. K2S TaxID=3056386 RepID=UPI0025A38E95|nr:HTH domain-containing protein [Labilibaculum sp. K2S]MDM8159068.1 HTH domain-containing protein [Labilibaculum sp. K2S]